MIPGHRLCKRWLGFGSLKVSSIPTSKDGDRIWTLQAREGTSRVREARGELRNTKEHSRNGVQAAFKCKEESEAGKGPRTGND